MRKITIALFVANGVPCVQVVENPLPITQSLENVAWVNWTGPRQTPTACLLSNTVKYSHGDRPHLSALLCDIAFPCTEVTVPMTPLCLGNFVNIPTL